MKEKRSLLQRLILAPHLLWSALFIVVPMLMVAWYAFTDKKGNFSFDAFAAVFNPSNNYLSIFAISIFYAVIATVICLILAYPLAYIISRIKPGTQSIMIMLVMLPMWMNLLLRTFALKLLLEDNGIINSMLSAVGLQHLKLIDTPVAVIYGMVYNFLPYMILPIYSVMIKLDKSLVEAAEDLGCNRMQVLQKVVFPHSLSGVVSGITMVFVPSVTTFYISQKLNSSEMLIGDKINDLFMLTYNYNVGAAVSLILMVLIFMCLFIMNKYADDDSGGLMV